MLVSGMFERVCRFLMVRTVMVVPSIRRRIKAAFSKSLWFEDGICAEKFGLLTVAHTPNEEADMA